MVEIVNDDRITPETDASTTWILVNAFLMVFMLYAGLHKVAVPLALKLTSLSRSRYAEIDFGFLYVLSFWWAMRKQGHMTRLNSALAGAGIAYGAYELMEVLLGRLPGWLAISRLLSSLPICGLAITVLTSKNLKANVRWGWLGALGFLSLAGLREIL